MRNAEIFNFAKNILASYEREDFKNDYAPLLVEDTHAVRQNIERILQRENGFSMLEKSEEITEWILENYENSILDFSGFHVGDKCVSSVAFGEQHASFSDLDIPQNKWKQATVIFESLDFMVNDGAAFYIIDGGIKLDLDSFISYDYKNRCFASKLVFCEL